MRNNQFFQPIEQSYNFQSPLQKRIYARLLFLGSAPAMFYRETRNLIASTRPLIRITSFISSLLQETEIALRKTFLPYNFTSVSAHTIDHKNSEYHKREIEVIAHTYNFSEDLQRQWIEVATHIRSIHQLVLTYKDDPLFFLSPDFTSETLLTALEFLFDTILTLFENQCIQIFALLDTLLTREKPDPTNLTDLSDKIPHNYAIHAYFFSRLYYPAWLEPLYNQGFFAFPPSKAEIEGSRVPFFFFWPQLHYLLRMASIPSAQPTVLAITQSIAHTDNPYIHSYIAQIEQALSLPRLNRLKQYI